MGNMSYCRFQNTLGDLRDCYEHMDSGNELSPEEQKARERLIKLCVDIAADFGEQDDD
jgi:L-asparaginase II